MANVHFFLHRGWRRGNEQHSIPMIAANGKDGQDSTDKTGQVHHREDSYWIPARK